MSRILFYLSVALAVVVVVLDLWAIVTLGDQLHLPLGQVWYTESPLSLNAFQVGVQRYLIPWLWDPVIVKILLKPVWIVMVGATLLLWLPCATVLTRNMLGRRNRGSLGNG